VVRIDAVRIHVLKAPTAAGEHPRKRRWEGTSSTGESTRRDRQDGGRGGRGEGGGQRPGEDDEPARAKPAEGVAA